MKKKLKKANSLGRYFTLIELLVVIAIIACLASMLLPALQGAKQKTKSIVCVNGLSQVYKGAYLYINDFNDYYPPALWTGSMRFTEPIWNNTGINVRNGSCNWAWLMAGTKYISDNQILRSCPFLKDNAAPYALNFFAATAANNTYSTNTTKQNVFWKFTKIKYPSVVVFFSDSQNSRSVCYHASHYADKRPAPRHNGRVNAIRMAGNVTTMAPQEYMKEDTWAKYQ